MTIFNLKVLYTRFLSVNLISIDFFICNLVNVISRNQNAFKTDKYAIRKINMVKTIFIQKINVFGIVYILLKILQHNSYKRRWTKCCTSAYAMNMTVVFSYIRIRENSKLFILPNRICDAEIF